MSIPIRQGIRPETLANAGVVYTGSPEPGSILIPYFDIGESASPSGVSVWRKSAQTDRNIPRLPAASPTFIFRPKP